MRILLVLLVVVMTVAAGLTPQLIAGDILPGGNGGVPALTSIAGDILPGGNGEIPAFYVAGDILPGGNG